MSAAETAAYTRTPAPSLKQMQHNRTGPTYWNPTGGRVLYELLIPCAIRPRGRPQRSVRGDGPPSVSTSGETSWIVYSVSLEGMNEVV